MSELLEQLIEECAQAAAKRAMVIIAEQKFMPPPDPLLTAAQVGRRIGLSHSKVRDLARGGMIHCAPGLKDIRIRQSVADAYGKGQP